MNTQSNAMPETPIAAQGFAPAVIAGRPAPVLVGADANCGRTARSISRRWPSPA